MNLLLVILQTGPNQNLYRTAEINPKGLKLPINRWDNEMNRQLIKDKTQMASNNFKKHPTTLVIREMQIRTMWRCHLVSVRMAIKKRWRGCAKRETLIHCCWKCKLIQPLWNSVLGFLKELKIGCPHDPAIPLLGKYPNNSTSYHRDICTFVFIAALSDSKVMEST